MKAETEPIPAQSTKFSTSPQNEEIDNAQCSALTDQFHQIFGSQPAIYQAPGRVNLIGEHTDYNDGFVMPAAIGFYTYAAIAERDDSKLMVHSVNYSERAEFDLQNLPKSRANHWSDYVVGVAKVLSAAGIALRGANLLLSGKIPQGAGLSSSASIEVVTAFALLDLAGKEIDKKQLARWCQQAENEFVGARCGIMDQFISSHGKRDHALLLDCRSLEFRPLPLPENARLVVCNTMVKHSIADGKYNERRHECEQGVQLLTQYLPAIKALRDVTETQFAQFADTLPTTIRNRCRHVISENARTLAAAAALGQNKLVTFGQLMNESHHSLKTDYEVSCTELDLMVHIAMQVEGVYGARMMGGGFGGCTINLVQVEQVENFTQTIAARYEQLTKIKPEIYVCAAAEGARKIA